MKAIGKWRFIKEREDRAYRTGRHDDFEVLTAGIGENSSSGIKLDGSTYHVNHDCWAFEEYQKDKLIIAESQKVEWDGAGMPPIGQSVVFFLNPCFDYDKEIVPPEGTEMEVVAHKKTSDGNEVAVCYWDKNGGGMAVCLVPDSLMPKKSEADKKRDEAIEAIASYALPYKCGADIYDAIAAGKIPGVRIE